MRPPTRKAYRRLPRVGAPPETVLIDVGISRHACARPCLKGSHGPQGARPSLLRQGAHLPCERNWAAFPHSRHDPAGWALGSRT